MKAINKVLFLFGAGLSIPAGMPRTAELTTRVLSGEGVYRFTDSIYYIEGDIPPGGRDGIPVILFYLNILNKYIGKYFHEKKEITYEDIYYLARQIADSLDEEIENPGLGPMLSDLRGSEALTNMLKEKDFSLQELANEACNYIIDIISKMLVRTKSDFTSMQFLLEASKDTDVNGIEIFSLNHDTLVEDFLVSNEIDFTDGFDKAINNLRWWKSELFSQSTARIRVFKLHGSINWYKMQFDLNKDELGRVAIVLDGDHWHGRNPAGQSVRSIQHRPLILAGTFNKIMEYSTGLFAINFFHFLDSLRETNLIVIVGYSFGDKGINTAIIEWMYSNEINRIILIHGDLDGLKQKARWAIGSRLETWIGNKRILRLPKWVQAVGWVEIKTLLTADF